MQYITRGEEALNYVMGIVNVTNARDEYQRRL